MIDDVRRLPAADDAWWDEDGNCFRFLCDHTEEDGEHAPECPWRAWPQIVTSIEAHEAIVRELAEVPILKLHHTPGANGTLLYVCMFCDPEEPQDYDALHLAEHHEPRCTWRRARELYPRPERDQVTRGVLSRRTARNA